MGFLGNLLRPKSDILKDKIIITQKQRIMALEKDILERKQRHDLKEDELNKERDNHERAKERLIDQIVELSDKFAEINQRMLDVAHDNARMKVLLDPPKKSTVLKKTTKTKKARTAVKKKAKKKK